MHADAAAIARVHVQSWHETYRGIVDDAYLDSLSVPDRTKRWIENLQKPENECVTFVAQTPENEIVGFISGGISRQEGENYDGELYSVYILRDHQNKGVGLQLLQALACAFNDIGLQNMLVFVLKQNDSRNFTPSTVPSLSAVNTFPSVESFGTESCTGGKV